MKAREIDFQRAEIFLDDMYSLTGEDPDNLISVASLVQMLYEDFLLQIRSHYQTEEMIKRLLEKRSVHHRHLTVESEEDWIDMKWSALEIDMKRQLALRGEVFLQDLRLADSKFKMTLHELISILFWDFIIEVRKGNQRNLIKLLLSRMRDWD
ncbi:hypothetical protein FPZ44_24945 [Paenibacillus agilis]|uniref:Uncharacterized protein n=1 Tax=Paenibacillus agilis TaxID=3020863 RepID=A0A559IDQ3_9BACL|nr:hypothetical protein FPZ44_24945 [Paenibacillus agilis]